MMPGMTPLACGLLLVVVSYLIGSIPFGLIVAWVVKRIDIRQHGSRNIGATNVWRVCGPACGISVFTLDLLKGLLPVALLPWAYQSQLGSAATHWQVAMGVAAVAGHMFPCWLGFRGGKGVSTALGVVLWLSPWASLTAAATFAIVFRLWWFVSLASIVAAIAFSICQLAMLLPAPFRDATWSLASFGLLVPALIIIRHRTNIGRLIRGEEPRFQARSANPGA